MPAKQVKREVNSNGVEGKDVKVVISGMSGAYPSTKYVKGLSEILYNKVNPISESSSRWQNNYPGLPHYVGIIPELDKFDAQFFKVHARLGFNMDPMSKLLLEQVCHAIYDAGYSPQHLNGRNIGVYVGSCFSETEKASFYVASNRTGFGIAGCSKAMFANRISYWLNIKGPSMSIDAACASSVVALENAYKAMMAGEIEAAIVGGANLCLHPQSSIHYSRIMPLSMEGKTKSFDMNANGSTRSEAINVLFLQRADVANRIYAEVCHARVRFPLSVNNSNMSHGPYRNPDELAEFIKNFYEDTEVSPQAVEYVEGFGAGIVDVDKAELQAIEKVYCDGRKDPLLVGSVISNIGYTEAASGISSITKVCLAFHTGEIASNLHFETPYDDVESLKDGRMRIVSDHQKFGRTYAAVNSLSVTGLNGHVLLHGHYKPKDPSRYLTSLPHLVTISSRQDTGVLRVIEEMKSNPVDPEQIALLHNIHEYNTTGYLGRGYVILGQNENKTTKVLAEKAEYFDDAKRPLWFVYSGMGSQWAGMGAELMRIPIFAAAIERCRLALKPKGIDIVHIITTPDKTIFDNILHAFVGIAAVQIGLTDILKELGLEPDMIIGHSVGELGCAYADGCMTAEEMILSAYSRGLVSLQTKLIRGSMAAVGVGYETIAPLCPSDIEVACHNGPESSTISGPAQSMTEFVEKLTAQGIFAKEVACANIAYHSSYIQDAGPGLLKYLREVLKTPKKRSERWLSTSVPQKNWGHEEAQYSSAEYHTNNLLRPVLFEETSRLIPANAVLIEVAPHGLLQAILKRSLPESCVNIPLTRRGHSDNVVMFLDAIGKLYMTGYNPKVKALYPKVDFPVSTGTPLLSHFVDWAHHESWKLALYHSAMRTYAPAATFVISPRDDEHKYLEGHVVNGENILPLSKVLVCVWDTLAMFSGHGKREPSIKFNDVHIYEQPLLIKDQPIKLHCSINNVSGYFEVNIENRTIVSGYAKVLTEVDLKQIKVPMEKTFDFSDSKSVIAGDDVYKMLHESGFGYKDEFRSILKTDTHKEHALISWTNNWVTAIDAVIQLNIFRRQHKSQSEVTFVRQLLIDVEEHKRVTDDDCNTLHVEHDDVQNETRSGGIVATEVKINDLPTSLPDNVELKTLEFSPYFQTKSVEFTDQLAVYLKLASESLNKNEINILYITSTRFDSGESVGIDEAQKQITDLKANVKKLYIHNFLQAEELNMISEADFIIGVDLSKNERVTKTLLNNAKQNIFILNAVLTRESVCLFRTHWRRVSSAVISNGRLELGIWRPSYTDFDIVEVTANSVDQLLQVKNKIKLDDHQKLIIRTSYPLPKGFKEIVQEWRKEQSFNFSRISVIMVDEDNSDTQERINLLDVHLPFNVWRNNNLGIEYLATCAEELHSEIPMTLQNITAGDLNTLQWVKASVKELVTPNVKVHFTGLNMRDAMRASGKTPWSYDDNNEYGYGMDFSGITERGERVMGLMCGGAASTHIPIDAAVLWPVPDSWNLEDAATVPLPYAHAFYILFMRKHLNRGSSILVQSGAGALGQAIITIALAHDCIVFTTVSEVKKKHILRKLFPTLPLNHIGNSRDLTFQDMVINETKGQGCDLVISSAKGQLKEAFFHCVSDFGTLVDTSLVDVNETSEYRMSHMTNGRNYVSVQLSKLLIQNDPTEIQELQRLISKGISAGYVRPITRVKLPALDVVRGVRLLLGGRLHGRVLFQLYPELPYSTDRLELSPDASHIIASDKINTFVLRFADMLVSRGAKDIVLVGYQKSKSDWYMMNKFRTWKQIGVKTTVYDEKLTSDIDFGKIFKLKSDVKIPVEGVYFIAGREANVKKEMETILQNLDNVARMHHETIRFFAVVSESFNFGKNICVNRHKDGNPATLIPFEAIDKFEEPDLDKKIQIPSALNAVERAILSKANVVIIQKQEKQVHWVDMKISSILGKKQKDEIDENSKIENYIDMYKCRELYEYLKDKYNVALEDVPELSIGGLREILKNIRTAEINKGSGLNVFFNHIDLDEMSATAESILVPTMANSATQRDDEFNPDEPYLMIIPGLDCHYERFYQLCERLKVSAVVLQPGLDYPHETIPEIAQRLVKNMLKMINIKDSFFLLGYSFGTLIVLEMAAILEEKGYVGIVYCVDGSPEIMRKTLKQVVPSAESELQDSIILHMYSLMTKTNSVNLKDKLESANSWTDKVDLCMRELAGKIQHSTQYARAVIESGYGRIEQALKYDAAKIRTRPLNSRIVVLNASEPASSDLGLSKYTVHRPVVYPLEATHATVLEHLDCPNIINKNLGTDIINKFEKINLCESFLMNADTFMKSS